MRRAGILAHLREQGAIYTDSHFVYTSGAHGTGYVNMRVVAYQAWWLQSIAGLIAHELRPYQPDLVLGIETLGRSIAGYTAVAMPDPYAIWCSVVGQGTNKAAVFSDKLGFADLVEGKNVAIVDDLLTTGSSFKHASGLVTRKGGTPVVGLAVVRRTPEVTAEDCGLPSLAVLTDIPNFQTYTPEQCADIGPCSQRVPMRLRPGHGWQWHPSHPDYPVASSDVIAG